MNVVTKVHQNMNVDDWKEIKTYLLPRSNNQFKQAFIGIIVLVTCVVFNRYHDFNNITTIETISWIACAIIDTICILFYFYFEEIVLTFMIKSLSHTIFNDITFYEDYFVCEKDEILLVHYKKIRMIEELNRSYAIRIKNDKYPIIFINKKTYEARYALNFMKEKVK